MVLVLIMLVMRKRERDVVSCFHVIARNAALHTLSL